MAQWVRPMWSHSLPRSVPPCGHSNPGAQNTFTRRELLSVYRQQFNAARNSLRQALSTQITQLYANGRPTAEQLANFRTLASGAIDATAFRVSSQLALLPRATDRLVAQLQSELLGNNRASLVSRINNFVNSSRINQSAGRLDAAVNRALGSFTTRAQGQFANFLTTTPIHQLSQDATTGAKDPASAVHGPAGRRPVRQLDRRARRRAFRTSQPRRCSITAR